MVEPSPVTGFPGMNLRLEGFGVGADWMKRNRRATWLRRPFGLLARSVLAMYNEHGEVREVGQKVRSLDKPLTKEDFLVEMAAVEHRVNQWWKI